MGAGSPTKNKIYINEDFKGISPPPLTTDQTKQILSQLEKNVCKIYSSNDIIGTGFFCKIPYPNQFSLLPVLITNNHILNKEDIQINKKIKISVNDDKIEIYLMINEERKIFTSDKMDVTIIEIQKNDNINNYLDIDENIFESDYNKKIKDNTLYILQYPNGHESAHSEGKIKEINDLDIRHYCPTDYGSSGSPILNLSNFKVIGVHKRRTKLKFNEGIFIKFAIEV